MKMDIGAAAIDELVSLERGEIDRRIFSDEEIFEQEMDLIFGRAWQFLCHETQIPKTGDFFETPIGRDNVLSVRQKDGSIKALLNTCMHRGNAVCRAEEGNTKNFMCTYHGWTYDLAGNLVGVPDLHQVYQDDLDKSKYGLRSVAQLAIYHGFVFGTMDESAPPLEEYLGAAGRLGIDLVASRDVEVIPGIQKYIIECNWKFAVDNLFDWYHPQITHMSVAQTGFFPSTPGAVDAGGAKDTLGKPLDIPSALAVTDEIAFIGEYGHAIAGPSLDGLPPNAGADHSWRSTPKAVEWLGPVGARSFGHPNIFPNSWIANGPQLSLRVPVSPSRTEIWWFTFVPKDATPEQRKMTAMMTSHGFGPAGLLEQDDGENWSQSTLQTRGLRSRRIPQLLKMGLGRGKVIKEDGLAHIEGTTSEHGQLWLYYSWAQWMKGLSWDELKQATMPPDIL
jgi:3-phenylpropionate/trans-cinnamate dioxygenase alpha subunit